ncbi:MAG TPA: hypothetical protein VHX38_35130 [Pseudonocardiaceae bacterium]|jgi:hypothetical protein|nr:hypothetical protein [Pseudonocardiaceae bacterium]
MSTTTETRQDLATNRPATERPLVTGTDETTRSGSESLPTAPCSVVWSRGHAYVLELIVNRPRWVGVDDRGRAVEFSCADLQRRGWSRRAN